MPTIQSAFPYQTLSLIPGAYAHAYEPRRVTARFARGLLRAGLMGFKMPSSGLASGSTDNSGDPGEVWQTPSYPVAADVDAVGTITSATGTKTISSGVTAGALADLQVSPARALTVTFDASTDWDPSNATITFVNVDGDVVSETLAIATSTTATTVALARQFISLTIPAQTGATGTATIGVAALSVTLTAADFVGIVVRQPIKTMVNPSNLYVGPVQSGVPAAAVGTIAHYVDGETAPLLLEGAIVVVTEEAVSDLQPVFVRVAAGAGGSTIGAFRNDADGGSCVAVTAAKFIGNHASGAAIAQFVYV